jgi:outer membrane protein TolC
MAEGEALRAQVRAAREAVRQAKDNLRRFGPEEPALVSSVPDLAMLVAEIDQFKREVLARKPDIM